MITDALLGAAGQLRHADPRDKVAIVVASSSQARHRLVGSVAVALARRSPVPIVIVP
jgi:nucleotide-binding universal stress UspA family protein